jgi:hypothetical protein
LSTEIEIEVFSYYSNIHLMTMVTLAITWTQNNTLVVLYLNKTTMVVLAS